MPTALDPDRGTTPAPADTAAPYERVSVIVACLDEEDTIGECLRRAAAALPGAEILVLHGGTDRTLERARAVARDHPAIRCEAHPDDRGKGHAIHDGIARTGREVIAQLDADLQFYPEDLPAVLAPILAGEADVVIGSRFLDRGRIDESYRFSFLRDVGNRVVNGYLSLLSGQRLSDVTTGAKAWTREAHRRAPFRDRGYVYEMEILMRGARAGARIAQVPVRYAGRQGGVSGHGAGAREVWSLVRTGAALLGGGTLVRLGWW